MLVALVGISIKWVDAQQRWIEDRRHVHLLIPAGVILKGTKPAPWPLRWFGETGVVRVRAGVHHRNGSERQRLGAERKALLERLFPEAEVQRSQFVKPPSTELNPIPHF